MKDESINENIPNQIEEPKKQETGKVDLREWLTTIAGGVIGSVLTLTILP